MSIHLVVLDNGSCMEHVLLIHHLVHPLILALHVQVLLLVV